MYVTYILRVRFQNITKIIKMHMSLGIIVIGLLDEVDLGDA